MDESVTTMFPTGRLVLAIAMAWGICVGAEAAPNGRDGLIYYDASGKILGAVYARENANVLSALPKVTFDPSMLDKATIIEDDPPSGLSDVVAITWDEAAANLAISFNTGPTQALRDAWPDARVVQEQARTDVSYLLSDASLDRGDRLIFVSSVPEPETWLLMLLGLAGIGALMRSHLKPAPRTKPWAARSSLRSRLA